MLACSLYQASYETYTAGVLSSHIILIVSYMHKTYKNQLGNQEIEFGNVALKYLFVNKCNKLMHLTYIQTILNLPIPLVISNE